ncbi:MAG: N-acyl homoserine lactonase family protein [Bacteroidota bacterium]|uniref:N-acyl homoserine lactonase family protein n=1 Tax=Flagellimonas profundi TaxID=2915620 RepID=A0ABS3FI26_9FLAO|nr:N-acyl homoserine lactonase family protein [Allomuricauda profundi]MBO0342562.1 N-acyl homoserine lactonase family protein [Allomuricauda profundi]MEC7770848.1 N-acyl homoserine lactonase family protein [Bacteroidota bacterium]
MKIARIQTGKVRIKESQISRTNGITPPMAKVLFSKKWADWVPIYAWVIEHEEGFIVVDTGETYKTSVKGYLPKWHPYYALAVDFDVKPEDEIGPQLLKMGIDPKKDVNKVVLTHLHTDHAGGLHHFPNADILIERKEFKNASGLKGILAGYLPHRWPKWLDPILIDLPDKPYFSFDKSMPVTKDGKVMIVATPGHVANHISVIVEIDGIYYFLAGDTSYTQENLLNKVPDGIGTVESIGTLENILAFSRENPTIYLPSHDPLIPERIEHEQVVQW